MPVKQTKQISLRKLLEEDKKQIKNLKILSDNDKKRLGNVILEHIRDRTRSGVGVTAEGKEYKLQGKPYTPQYAKLKGSSKVDLTLSGDMLENMYVKDVQGTSVKLSVRDEDYGKLRGAEEGIERVKRDSKGKIIKVDGKTLPAGKIMRPFFHLSNNDKKKIVQDPEFKRTFERAIKRLEKKRK